MKIMRSIGLLLLTLVCASAQAQISTEICGTLRNGFGPFDYRADHQKPSPLNMSYSEKRILVEGAHFTARVEAGIGSESNERNGPAGGDIDYTLRAFPNNHRALIAVMRLGEMQKSDKPIGLKWVIECYMERAIRFASDDPIVRIIYSTFLAKKNRMPEAIEQLDQASKLAENNGFTHYNIGLTFFDLKRYDKALVSAHRAMAVGFERNELAEKLKAAGQWREPEAAEADAAASSASAAASVAEPAKP